ncbi:helix-turn-helix domain-containing protein, partial [Bacillus pacificus]
MITQLGQTIRNLRKQKGISLQNFAEQIEVSPGYLSNLETQ